MQTVSRLRAHPGPEPTQHACNQFKPFSVGNIQSAQFANIFKRKICASSNHPFPIKSITDPAYQHLLMSFHSELSNNKGFSLNKSSQRG